MDIYLIRHGEKQEDGKNHGELGLTPKGFQQADLLGQRLERVSKRIIERNVEYICRGTRNGNCNSTL